MFKTDWRLVLWLGNELLAAPYCSHEDNFRSHHSYFALSFIPSLLFPSTLSLVSASFLSFSLNCRCVFVISQV